MTMNEITSGITMTVAGPEQPERMGFALLHEPIMSTFNNLFITLRNFHAAPGIQRIINFKLVFKIFHIFRKSQTVT